MRCGWQRGRVEDELELVDRYEADLAADRSLAQIERWALPAQVRDLTADQSLWVPARCVLTRTSAEIRSHITWYGDAYFAYLMRIAIPGVLSYDRTFGHQAAQLRADIT